MKPSFSLKWLFVGIAVAAFVVTAFLNANKAWSIVFRLAVAGLTAVAGIRAFLLGRRASFEAGFAIASVVAMITPIGYVLATAFDDTVGVADMFSIGDEFTQSIVVSLVELTFACWGGAVAWLTNRKRTEGPV
ncbi:MAG: hypothetical protein U0836_21050 [Pirellulales bacterium]